MAITYTTKEDGEYLILDITNGVEAGQTSQTRVLKYVLPTDKDECIAILDGIARSIVDEKKVKNVALSREITIEIQKTRQISSIAPVEIVESVEPLPEQIEKMEA